MNTRWLVVFIILAGLTSCKEKLSQIHGTVNYKSGSNTTAYACPEAQVQLVLTSNNTIQANAVVCDPTGFYSIMNIENGNYTLFVTGSVNGVQYKGSQNIGELESGANREVDIQIQ